MLGSLYSDIVAVHWSRVGNGAYCVCPWEVHLSGCASVDDKALFFGYTCPQIFFCKFSDVSDCRPVGVDNGADCVCPRKAFFLECASVN